MNLKLHMCVGHGKYTSCMVFISDQSDRAISFLPKGHAHENSASYANESILSSAHAHEKPLFYAKELFRIIIKTSKIKLYFVHMYFFMDENDIRFK